MVDRELSIKFDLDPCSSFRDRAELNVNGPLDQRTDGRTDDGRLRHDSSSADKAKQS